MKSICLSSLAGFAVLAASFCLNPAAHAQATRTWVSGVGDDANPGSRTAPCKTLAGAYAKTATGGEIDNMDPGGFGAITINKALTIDGKVPLASILVSGTPAVIVNAGASDVVTVRNLALNGIGSGTYGVQIFSAGEVRLENCEIFGFVTNGIDFQPTGSNAKLYIINSHIHDCAGAGVFANPASGGNVVLINTVIEQCGLGVKASAGTVTLTRSTITGSTGAGLLTSGAGAIKTFHNNEIFGNNPDGNPTGSLPLR